MREATRLAARGMFKCFRCNNIAPQDEGIVVAYMGNVLLAIHPECMDGAVRIERGDSQIRVTMPKAHESSIIGVSGVDSTGLRVADPKSKKVTF